eukprot:COSAG01_NODE_60060_length_296_cov_1.827411_1_plen_54_part_10
MCVAWRVYYQQAYSGALGSTSASLGCALGQLGLLAAALAARGAVTGDTAAGRPL